MEDIIALIIILVFLGFGGSILGIVFAVFKKILKALGINTQTAARSSGAARTSAQYRQEPQYRPIRSSAGEKQLAAAMKNALKSAADRGESWAKTLQNSMPVQTKADVSEAAAATVPYKAQGEHAMIKPSGEGVYTEGMQHGHDEQLADSCRAVSSTLKPYTDDAVMTVHRAGKKAGSVAAQRSSRAALRLTPQSLQQGIIVSEILTGRGGRRRVH